MQQQQTPGIFTVDRDFRITSFSRTAQQLIGYNQEEVLGKRCFDLFCDPESARSCPMRTSMQAGLEMDRPRVRYVTKSQATVPLQVTTVPLLDAQRKVVGGVASFWRWGVAAGDARELPEDLWRFRVDHPQLRRILDVLPDVARSDAPVLLLGENGTGKNHLARAIHRLSRWSEGPWVKIDCGAYRERVLEVELFGCCRSKVHGIDEDRPGRVQLAAGGSVFLQDIDRIPSHLQAKLLRFLQDGEVEPLGGQGPEKVSARLIAASHADLRRLVEGQRFREDLFFRLNVFMLEIPPLRAMQEAIPDLISQMIQHLNRMEGKEVKGISPEGLHILMQYSFPGNMRELQNIIRHAHVLCKTQEIQPSHLPGGIVNRRAASDPSAMVENGKCMEEIEHEVILAALNRNQWNRKKTALELGIDRTTLWRKMRKMGWGTKIRPAPEASPTRERG